MRIYNKVYKLLEIIEMPENTNVHMINGKDYNINKNGELVSQDGDKLPISKNNINTCEFTILEEKKNYNFRVYKDNKLIDSFNRSDLTKTEAKELTEYLYYQNGGRINRYESYSMERFSILNLNVIAEVIVDK